MEKNGQAAGTYYYPHCNKFVNITKDDPKTPQMKIQIKCMPLS